MSFKPCHSINGLIAVKLSVFVLGRSFWQQYFREAMRVPDKATADGFEPGFVAGAAEEIAASTANRPLAGARAFVAMNGYGRK